jgi:hypothetical protein
MRNPEYFQTWKDKELDEYILSYCPNIHIPRRRSSKFVLVRDINFLKNKLPMSVPHPEKEGELITISLDTFMQGEKI